MKLYNGGNRGERKTKILKERERRYGAEIAWLHNIWGSMQKKGYVALPLGSNEIILSLFIIIQII